MQLASLIPKRTKVYLLSTIYFLLIHSQKRIASRGGRFMKRIIILCHILISPFWLLGQSCGLEDTILINPNATQTFQLQITDYFNDNLADPAQGVCGIELYFLHQFIDNLEISVTSPGGDVVQLIGPNTDEQFAFTFFSRWNITFLPCAETAMPDSGYVAQWSNEQPANFASGFFYDGSYYPHLGCLEDFNSGPVNGTWTFQITNNPSPYAGAILSARIIFCDSRGVDCCFAKAGDLLQADILACEGDTALALNLPPTIVGLRPDTSEYDYTYLISQNGILLDFDTLVDLTTYLAGTYEVCGLSYRNSQVDSLPIPDNVLTLDSLRSNLDGFFADFCGNISDSCVTVTIATPPPPTDLTISICAGDSYSVGDSTFTATGVYTVLLNGLADCDSVVNLNLTVVPDQTTQLTQTICRGDTVFVGTTPFFSSGLYTTPLLTGIGCDSTVILDLTVLEPVVETLSATICQGESYVAGNDTFTVAGNYTLQLMVVSGCDSVLELTLNVLQVQANIATATAIDCVNNGVTLDGSGSTPAGALTYAWMDLAGNALGASSTLAVDTGGTFILNVLLDQGGAQCPASDTIVVADIRALPIADAGLPDTLTCAVFTVPVGGSNSSVGAQFSYAWETTGGSFAGSQNTPTTLVNAPGDYLLIVTNTMNNCRDSATVTIEVDRIQPMADAGPDTSLTCARQSVVLDGSASSTGAPFTYEWLSTTNVVPVNADTPTPEVSVPGQYRLIVQNTINACADTAFVLVTTNTLPPNALIATPMALNCINQTVVLDGAASSPSDSITYQWLGAGLGSADTTNSVVVSEPGLYTLIVSNPYTQCADTTTVTVTVNRMIPTADAGLDTTVTCLRTSVVLGGSGTSSGSGIVYEWHTVEGSITGPADVPNIEVDTSGVYILFVTDTLNGCADTALVSVSLDRAPPFVNAGPMVLIDCASDAVTLTGTVSAAHPTAVSWTGNCILTPSGQLSINVDCAGDYVLTAVDAVNGCIRSDTANVAFSPFALFAVVADTTAISCETGVATINTAGTTAGFYQWFRNGVLTTITTLNPVVNEAGTYLLVVSNLDQSCTDSATAVVILDCIPRAIMALPDTITCIQELVQLDGSGSSSGAPFSYFWIAPDAGCIFDGQGTTMPRVRCGGEYQLVVTNNVVQLSDTVSVIVVIDTLRPIAIAEIPDTITCEFREVLLDAGNSSSGNEIAYVWTSLTNDTLSQTATAFADLPGTYLLEVYNTNNGCRAVDFVQVFQSDVIPRIIFPNTIFPCLQDSFRLTSFVDPPDGSFSYAWSGAGIIGNTDSAFVQISEPGVYILSVTELNGNCTTIDTAVVIEQNCVPCLTLMEPASLTCTNGTTVLEVSFCEPCIGCTLQWTTNGSGIILSGEQTLTPTVGAAGVYTLVATDTLGFQSTLNVTVTGATDPDADAGPDRQITCDSISVTLGSVNTPTGSDFAHQWSALGMGIPLPDNERFTVVNVPDTYVLEVLNTQTGCFARDTVLVGSNLDTPMAEAGSPAAITCAQAFVVLDGSGSTFGSNLTYSWTNGAPNCIQGAATLNPIVSCPGVYRLTVRNTLSGCTATDSVIVASEGAPPTLLPIPDTSLNCTRTEVLLTGNAPNLTGFTIQWCALDVSNNVILNSCVSELELLATQPGRYRFTLQNDTTGCIATGIVTVFDDRQLPAVDAGEPATLFCAQDSLFLQGSANPNLEYQWSALGGSLIANANTLSPTIYNPDTFILQVTNPLTNCVSRDTVIIQQDQNTPISDAGLPDTLTCSLISVNLSGQGSTTSGNIAWQWTTDVGNIVLGAATPTPLVNRRGAYYLTVRDPLNNCTVTDTVFIEENKFPPNIDLAGFPDLQLTCIEDTITFDASNSTSATGMPLSFQWDAIALGNLIGDPTASVIQADRVGTYRLIITDLNNTCRDTLLIPLGASIADPIAVVATPLPLGCLNNQTTLDGTGSSSGPEFRYEWRDPNGLLLPETGISIQVSVAGDYTFTVINTSNGCDSEVIETVVENRTLPIAIAEAEGLLDCETQEVLLDGSNSSSGPRYTYAWSTDIGLLLSPVDAVSVLAGAAGAYVLTVRDIVNGCEAKDTVQAEAVGNFIEGAMLSLLPPACDGQNGGTIIVESVQGGTGPFLFALNSTIYTATQTFRFLLPGEYRLQVQDANGCEWDTLLTMPELLPPVVDLGPDINMELGDTIRLEALVNGSYESLLWSPAAAFFDPTLPVQRVSPSETMAFTVVVRDEFGCQGSDNILITVAKPVPVFIPDAFSPNGDGQNDVLVIFAGDGVRSIVVFNIFDRWGNLVFGHQQFQPNDPTFGWDGNFEGRPMNAAVYVYYVEVELGDGDVIQMKGDIVLMR